jgi:CRISPR/Cas system-associated exonuclease Cas4 (RecB family)
MEGTNRDPFERLYEAMGAELIQEARDHKPSALRFTASTVGNCPWRQWYNLSGYRPAPLSPEAKVRMIQGEIDHNVIRNLFRKYGIEVRGVEFFVDEHSDYEFVDRNYLGWPVWETMSVRKTVSVGMPDGLTDTIELSARADGVVDTPEGEAIFEFKGMGQWPYKKMQEAMTADGAGSALAKVRANKWYSWQMQVSMFLFGFERAWLGMKHRSDAQCGIITADGVRNGVLLPYDQKLVDEILQTLAAIQRLVRKGEPPDRTQRELKDSGACRNCEFFYVCHGADERKKKGLEPVVLYPGPQFEEHNESEKKA